jgi:hypothetical protein
LNLSRLPEKDWGDSRLSHSRDVATYIIASNARRHMSKGQQAMVVAMMHPEPAKTKRKGSGSLEPKELGISGARIYSAASAAGRGS